MINEGVDNFVKHILIIKKLALIVLLIFIHFLSMIVFFYSSLQSVFSKSGPTRTFFAESSFSFQTNNISFLHFVFLSFLILINAVIFF